MRLEWLEDIVAVIETGSFLAAAERRFVTQPAFSRRIRAIEDHVGAELFDRERKPVRLKPSVANHQDDIRRLIADLKDLVYELRSQGRETHNRIIIASQHALTDTRSPAIVETLTEQMDVSIRLRSANRDECLALLVTRQADLLISYQSAAEAAAEPGSFLERAILGTEEFIPILAASRLPQVNEAYARGELPIIAYPSDAFLGRIFNEEVLPRILNAEYVHRKVETALTLAALQFAINGVGVAWVPRSLASEQIAAGVLADLSDVLPATTLCVTAVRVEGSHTKTEELLWTVTNSQPPILQTPE